MKTIKEILGSRTAYSVRPGMTVREGVDYLVEKHVGAVAVCEGSNVIGVFSERDLLRRVVHGGLDPGITKIDDVMTREVFSVPYSVSHSQAMTLMLNKNFRHLAVVDEDQRYKGFVSMRELLEVDIAEARDLISRLNDNYYHHEFDQKRDQ